MIRFARFDLYFAVGDPPYESDLFFRLRSQKRIRGGILADGLSQCRAAPIKFPAELEKVVSRQGGPRATSSP